MSSVTKVPDVVNCAPFELMCSTSEHVSSSADYQAHGQPEYSYVEHPDQGIPGLATGLGL